MRFTRRRAVYGLQANKRRWPWFGAALAVAVIITIAGVVFFSAEEANAPQSTASTEQPSDENAPQSLVGKYMFSGTVVLARAVENDAKVAGGYDYSQPFSKMSTFNPKQYDEWMVDWECPTSDEHNLSFQYQVTNTVFNCRPEWIPEFSKYFSHANLANNHTADLGGDVFYKTRQHLEDGGIKVVGNYDPSVSDDVCEVMSMSVHVQKPDGTEQDGLLPIAMCAWHYFERDPQPGEIEVMNQYAEVMPVFGLMQVGVEYRPTNDSRQAEVGRAIIDSGAEFVVGNSPHWVQNTEVYKGKPIFYSTGNFIFDQLETETNRGVSIAVSMKVPYNENVEKWLKLGESCKDRGDDCLAQAKSQGLQKLDIDLTYQPVASINGAHVVTMKAPTAVQAAVEQRMNWAETSKELGQ